MTTLAPSPSGEVTRSRKEARAWKATSVSGPNRALRITVGLFALALSVFLIRFHEQARIVEAGIMTAILKPIYGEKVNQWADVFMVQVDPSLTVGLRITSECTTVVLLVPLLALSGAVLAFTRVRWTRWAAALSIGITLAIAINLARIGIVAAALIIWGQEGYEWTHTFVGTVFALAGLVGTVIIMLRIMIGTRRSRKSLDTQEKRTVSSESQSDLLDRTGSS